VALNNQILAGGFRRLRSPLGRSGRKFQKEKIMTKEIAIAILEQNGWVINNPAEIEIVRSDETGAVLRQVGNGTWYVSGQSVNFIAA
jgi:hypothetical protein